MGHRDHGLAVPGSGPVLGPSFGGASFAIGSATLKQQGLGQLECTPARWPAGSLTGDRLIALLYFKARHPEPLLARVQMLPARPCPQILWITRQPA